VKFNATPAAAEAGVETTKCAAPAALRAMALEVPVIAAFTESVAVMVWLPAVLRVVENVPVPFVNVEFAGKGAAGSVLVKWTVPV